MMEIKSSAAVLREKKKKRPDWDSYILDIVDLVSRRSTCCRRSVGAGLVRDSRILATGYNGAPSKLQHCLDIGCLREQLKVPSGERHELCRGLHAEAECDYSGSAARRQHERIDAVLHESPLCHLRQNDH
jgi:dCMP deaminase